MTIGVQNATCSKVRIGNYTKSVKCDFFELVKFICKVLSIVIISSMSNFAFQLAEKFADQEEGGGGHAHRRPSCCVLTHAPVNGLTTSHICWLWPRDVEVRKLAIGSQTSKM